MINVVFFLWCIAFATSVSVALVGSVTPKLESVEEIAIRAFVITSAIGIAGIFVWLGLKALKSGFTWIQ